MSHYQLLLDEAVALVNAERAFIVLWDASTNRPTEFTALRNFDAAAAQEPVGEETGEEQYIWELLPSLMVDGQPRSVSNGIYDAVYRERTFKQWPLRRVILIPLKKDNIICAVLWCDQRLTQEKQWFLPELEQVTALTERGEMLSPYQSLIDEAVTQLKADRGFIVLYDSETSIPTRIVAAHAFAAALVFQTSGYVPEDYHIIQKALPIITREKKPLLTYTYDDTYFPVRAIEGAVPGPRIRSVMVVPLRSANGLLWCDMSFANGLFKEPDLEVLVTLVERSAIS